MNRMPQLAVAPAHLAVDQRRLVGQALGILQHPGAESLGKLGHQLARHTAEDRLVGRLADVRLSRRRTPNRHQVTSRTMLRAITTCWIWVVPS